MLAVLMVASGCGPGEARPSRDDGEAESGTRSDLGSPARDSARISPRQTASERSARSADASAPTETASGEEAATSADDTPVPSSEPAEGLAGVRKLKRDGQFSEALRRVRDVANETEARELRLELRREEVALRRLQRNAVGLPRAIDNLAADTPAAEEFARRRLLQSGEAGTILLRKAVRDAAPDVAEEAALLLIRKGDDAWADSALDRIARDTDADIARTLLVLLQEESDWLTTERVNRIAGILVDEHRKPGAPSVPAPLFSLIAPRVAEVAPEFWPEVYGLVVDDEQFEDHRLVGLLGEAYRRLCEKNDTAFGELVGDPDAVGTLETSMLKLLREGPPELSTWATDAGHFLPLVPGFHGAYYKGPAEDRFRELHTERVDPKIQFKEGQFPQGSSNIACRWTGSLKIEQAGRYTFTSASDDGQRVWVDDKLIIDDWNHHGVKAVSGTIELEPGMVPIRVEFFQGSGGYSITVYWQGPGFERTVLGGNHVWTPPLAGEPAKDSE